jgi:hypothetical protein
MHFTHNHPLGIVTVVNNEYIKGVFLIYEDIIHIK